MKINRITDLDAPELHPFRTLRRSKEQYQKSRFVAEGEKVIVQLFRSQLHVLTVLLTDEWFSRLHKAIEVLTPSPVVYTGSKELLESVVGFNLHQGVMALAEIPPEPRLDTLLTMHKDPHLLLGIDGLLNAENVGVIVRNAHAFGVTGIIVGESSSSPYLRRAVRNSLGTVFSVPIIHTNSLAQTITMVREHHGVDVYAAESGKNGAAIDSVDLRNNVCLIVGGEDKGIRPPILRACSGVIEIPMVDRVDSLNVANATAIALYEVRRQRRR